VYRYLRRPKVDILKLIEQNRSVMGFNLIWLYEKGDYLKKLLEEIMKLNLKKPEISDVYEFDKLHIAIKQFQSGKTVGKVVVRVD
jgi:alcohol dehydrogenase